MFGGALTSTYFGGLFTQPYALVTTVTDLLRTETQKWLAGPFLTFYEIETLDGTFLRYVDYADKGIGAGPDSVTFDGKEWSTIKILRGELEDSLEVGFSEISLSIFDPMHSGAALLQTHDGFRGALVRIWITTEELLPQPEAATRRLFRLKQATISQGPARIQIVLGPPNVVDLDFPRLSYNRHRCFWNYSRRHLHDDALSYCTYPSDEFELQTKQFIKADTDAETALKHGWFILNGNFGFPVPTMLTGHLDTTAVPPGTDRGLHVDFAATDIRWVDATRNGVFIYKKIGLDAVAEEVLWDVECKLNVEPVTSKTQTMTGLLVQDINTPGNSWFWGRRKNGTTVNRFRSTESNSSTDTDITFNFEDSFRLERVGNNQIKAYARFESIGAISRYQDATNPWQLMHTESTPAMGNAFRVGLLFSSDESVTSADYVADILHFRFRKGGLKKCLRDLTDCRAHSNEHQFGGFHSIPDSI